MAESMHWADQTARRVVAQKGEKERYTVAAGITPSGTVHIGNFREMITVDLVYRALKDLGKNTRFIYSWDDYDVFRKVPKNMPKQDLLTTFLRKPIVDTPDTFGCHSSYAEHNEKEVEDVIPIVGISPDFKYQSKKYRGCEYKDEIKFALNNKEKVRVILDKFREEPLPKEWYPVSIYCEKCNRDDTEVKSYDGNYTLAYTCQCGYEGNINFSKKGNVKLPWRLDWPMRWHYEGVDFEPGGKEHSTEGGSYTTAKLIVKELYNQDAPVYQKYDFIILKGVGGKMSSSSGNVITLKDTLAVYEPAIIRYLFAGTRPETEFSISFDLDVLKIYEDFDKCERIYYKKEEVAEKEFEKQKRIYELSCIDKPSKEMPFQPSLRHLCNMVQVYEDDYSQVIASYSLKEKSDIDRLKMRAVCASNWLKKYAPDDMRFTVKKEVTIKLEGKEKEAVKNLVSYMESKSELDEKLLYEEIYNISRAAGVEPKDFFKVCYQILIGKEKGPKLAGFILIIGKDRVLDLLKQAI
ncbi:MAG TPA: lysine--tRNA ligase [Candidatus Nanoarchaeia archaeon]|nr:lysine--tRNA ligase [Candidatus Nanoarchaeia archaeon]